MQGVTRVANCNTYRLCCAAYAEGKCWHPKSRTEIYNPKSPNGDGAEDDAVASQAARVVKQGRAALGEQIVQADLDGVFAG